MTGALYKRYLLFILLLIFSVNSIDRIALGLVLQDIKLEFSLSDTQLGLLTGIAFALFYAFMGIPIARWADRGNRITIISVTTLTWSVAVALCGLAANFVQLLCIRIAVAVGEAGCTPPAKSLIADEFARAERPRAVAIYMMGSSLAMLIGYFAGGWLDHLFGWRIMFAVLALPGLVLGVLTWFTLREPRKTSSVVAPPDQSLKEVFAALWCNTTFRRLLFCVSATCFFSFGLLQWQPTFFVRSFGLESMEVGMWFAAIYGVGGMAGAYMGGALASRFAARNEPLQLKLMATIFASYGLVMAGVYLSPNKYLAFAFTAVASVGGHLTNGPLYSIVLTLVPERMRAMAIALVYLFANLVGLGLGPLAIGALSDAFRPWAGESSLHYALLTMCPGVVWGASYLWLASRSVSADLARVQANERQPQSPPGIAEVHP